MKLFTESHLCNGSNCTWQPLIDAADSCNRFVQQTTAWIVEHFKKLPSSRQSEVAHEYLRLQNGVLSVTNKGTGIYGAFSCDHLSCEDVTLRGVQAEWGEIRMPTSITLCFPKRLTSEMKCEDCLKCSLFSEGSFQHYLNALLHKAYLSLIFWGRNSQFFNSELLYFTITNVIGILWLQINPELLKRLHITRYFHSPFHSFQRFALLQIQEEFE